MILTNEQVKALAPMIGKLVQRFARRVPSHITEDDIRGAAYVGLCEAAEKFDESKGWQFSTFAAYRVKGAILDYLRALDWVPRVTRKRTRDLELAFMAATRDARTEPTDEQVAEAAGLSLDDYHDTVAATSHREVRSFDSAWSADEVAIAEMVGDRGAANPEQEAGYRLFLERALGRLNPKERAVILGCDLGGATLREVAEELGIGESRACQLRRAAYEKMRG